MRSERVGSRGLAGLREELGDRGTSVVLQVGSLRLMSGAQIATVHFQANNHVSRAAAARACSRELARLTKDRLLVRLGRRIGGIRAGSSSYIYALGPVGHRLLALNGPRPRFREPSALFVDHTLAVSQLVVDLTLAVRMGRCEILAVQAEPTCWRTFSGVGGRLVLRPDLFVALGIGEFEVQKFVEIDRGTEHLPALLRKCQVYESFYRSGTQQRASGVFPRVCWIVPDETRAERLAEALKQNQHLTRGLFLVTTSMKAIDTMVQEPS
jgi:hypothetical protein